jgi:hypothetical protein
MQLLRTILIILVVYYLFKLIARYVLPWIAKYFIKKVSRQYQDQNREPPRKKEGEISIDYKPEKKTKLDDLGEYVDYKEVKDESD